MWLRQPLVGLAGIAQRAGQLLKPRGGARSPNGTTACPGPTAGTAPSPERQALLWGGANLSTWLRLLARNRFAVHPAYCFEAARITALAAGNSLLGWLQEAWFGRRVRQTPFRAAPLFIVGHWRTGTTLLHELLSLDPSHNSPNTYQCFMPNHFLLTEEFGKSWLSSLLPSRRAMDNMAADWDRPQEDEWALCLLGVPSLYQTNAFPNRHNQDWVRWSREGMPPRLRAAWKKTFVRFLRQLTFKDPRRLVLKSPTHSCRIPTLLELFPDARFVHIVRDPHVVFQSTVNLQKKMHGTVGLQKPTFAWLEELVFHTFTEVYERIEQGKKLIPPGQFHELRYEELVADPVGQMRGLYDGLHLGDFGKVLPRLEGYLREHAGYQTNCYPKLNPDLRAEIGRRWGDVIRRYGYDGVTALQSA
jgi:hypothetical protein